MSDDTSNTAPTDRGRFITLEGGEGAGKSTQAKRLAERLGAHGKSVVLTREPGGSPGAEALRQVLLSGKFQSAGPEFEAVLFAAARADHVDETIRPALERGDWVVSDRFADSTRVYQADVDPHLIDALESIALDGVRPDLTLVFDLPTDVGLARAGRRRGQDAADRFERDDLAVHEARRERFLALARAEPARFVVIDATRDPESVADAVWYAVSTRLGLPPR